jgi:hypothetical protein
MGIDMSSAFDTIHRSTILRLLQDAGCSEDDIRLIRYLLANTKLRIEINRTTSGEKSQSEPFKETACLAHYLLCI